jgi:hypothetical protein
MNDAHGDQCKLDEWMDELVTFDRIGEIGTYERTSDGLHWMYRAALIRFN